MDPVTAVALAVTEGLKTFNLIYADIPPAERRAAWERWCEFWKPWNDFVSGVTKK